MSDSDEEFEKFLQESLTNSAASHHTFSHAASLSLSHGAGEKWLKSTQPSILATDCAEYSKDSLEGTGGLKIVPGEALQGTISEESSLRLESALRRVVEERESEVSQVPIHLLGKQDLASPDSVHQSLVEAMSPIHQLEGANHMRLKTSSRESQKSFSGEIPKVFNTENVNPGESHFTALNSSPEESSHHSSKTSSPTHEILKASSHEDLKTSSQEILKASSHKSSKTLSHESLKGSSRTSSKTSSHKSLKSLSNEDLRVSQHEILNTPSHRSSSHNSPKTLSPESLKASSHEDLNTLSHESQNASIHKSSRTSSQETLKASSHGSLKASDYTSPKVSAHEGPLTATSENPKTLIPTDVSQPNVKSSTINESVVFMKLPENAVPHEAIGGIRQAAVMMAGGDDAGGVARENAPKEKEESFTVYIPCSSELEGTSSLVEASKEPLERELAALQAALKAAGLPQLGETFTGPHTSTTDPHDKYKLETRINSVDRHSKSKLETFISSADPHSKSKLETHTCSSGPVDNKEPHSHIIAKEGITLSLHDAIREITTQELASVMKEVLEQERQDIGGVLSDGASTHDKITCAAAKSRSGWEWTYVPGHVTEGDTQGMDHEKPLSTKDAGLSVGRGTNRELPKAGKTVSSYGNRTHFSRQASGRLKQQSSSAEAERLQLRTAGPQRPENKDLGKEMRQGFGGMRRQGVGGAKGPGIGGKKIQGIGGHESHKLVAERGTDHSESKSAPKLWGRLDNEEALEWKKTWQEEKALHVQTTAQLREMVVQCGHMEEALKVAREREEACRAREGALKAALERKDVSKAEALRAKDELRAKEEALKAREEALKAKKEALTAREEALTAKEEALKAREEAVEAKEEALQEREEAAEAKEEALKREEEGLKEAGERADGREGALEKSKQELQEEVLSLTAKLNELEKASSSRQLLSTAQLTKEEKEALESNIREQEVILQGYQKENERLYEELAHSEKELKSVRARYFEENQKLNAELMNARAQQQRPTASSTNVLHSPGKNEQAAHLNNRVLQLEDQLERSLDKEKQLDAQVKQLKQVNHSSGLELQSLKSEVASLKVKRSEEVSLQKSALVDKMKAEHRKEVELLVKEHTKEIEALTSQVDMLRHNQRGVDEVCEQLREKEVEVKSLQDTITRMKGASGLEAEKVKQVLERRIKELEDIIQKKFPNSLSALIVASKAEHASSPSAYLEHRVCELQEELQKQDREYSLKVQGLQHKFSSIELQYEQQISHLRRELERAQEKSHNAAQVQACTMPQHEKLQASISELQEKLSQVTSTLQHERLQMEGKLAEAANKANMVEQQMNDKIAAIQEQNSIKLDKLVAKYAKEKSDPKMIHLSSQVAAMEATILCLRQSLESAKVDSELLTASRAREAELTQSLKVLSEQLGEARKYHTPEMHHVVALQTKISDLESRLSHSERLMSEQRSALERQAHDRIRELEIKWKRQLHSKAAEIDQFRVELDSILSVLQVLQDSMSL